MDWDHLYSAHFFNLTTLTFYVNTSTDVITVMQHSEFPSLKEFKMMVDELPCTEAEKLFHALSLCKACKTLQRIEILSYDEGGEDLPWTTLCQVGRTSAIWS
ncbi:hypothetical protein AZE42_12868 [Rhizopogon vesiculosus]|uniref:F-box domain-containing protein n=1 Tax=Rhizopogon vesiculosus TaxID=180088 RepID=A0A1J8PRY8_9AGAM|nr:hypothetical protein AZE42_12868 [Rhizopogon vesiculosus]